MRAELEKLVGAAAVDERAVRDLWPLSVMEVRDGKAPPRVLVARPSGREQLTAGFCLGAAPGVGGAPVGGGRGGWGGPAPAARGRGLGMGAVGRGVGEVGRGGG